MITDENTQRYVKTLYAVALLLIVVPLSDLTLRTFPPQFSSLQWRFTTVGLLLGNFGTILLGLGLMGLVAVLCDHRRFLRFLGYVSVVLSIVTIAVLALFALDAIQIRTLANANYKRAVLVAGAGAMFTAVFGAVTFFLIGRGAIAASRLSSVTAARRGGRTASPLVVAGRGAGDAL